MNMKKNLSSLDPNSILEREFDYAASTALQANEDRVHIYTFSLGTIVSLIALTIFPDLENTFHVYIFILIFLGISMLGFFSFLKLIKLRIAWIQSVQAMNTIKDFYRKNLREISLQDALLWRRGTIPKPGKKWTITFLMGTVSSILSSIAASVAIVLWLYLISGVLQLLFGIFVGIVCTLTYFLLWYVLTGKTAVKYDTSK